MNIEKIHNWLINNNFVLTDKGYVDQYKASEWLYSTINFKDISIDNEIPVKIYSCNRNFKNIKNLKSFKNFPIFLPIKSQINLNSDRKKYYVQNSHYLYKTSIDENIIDEFIYQNIEIPYFDAIVESNDQVSLIDSINADADEEVNYYNIYGAKRNFQFDRYCKERKLENFIESVKGIDKWNF